MTDRSIYHWREPRPDNYRWVRALATLAESVFADLTDCVRAASEDAKAIRSTAPMRECRFSHEDPTAFRVDVSGPPDNQPIATVEFKLMNLERIKVTTDYTSGRLTPSLVVGIPILQQDGGIAIQVSDERLAPWQFSRLVLEPLIFPGYPARVDEADDHA